MKKLYIVAVCAVLGACASRDPIANLPNTEVLVDKSTYVMTRNEMINAIKDCEAANTRPVVITTRRKVNGFLSEAPVDVTCMPKYIK